MNSHIDLAVASIKSEIARLGSVLASLENGHAASEAPPKTERMPVGPSATPSMPRATKRRGHRSTADVKQQAEEMVAFIGSKGKAGATTAEIVKQFGKTLPSIKAFITAKTDATLKTIGAGRATSYVVS